MDGYVEVYRQPFHQLSMYYYQLPAYRVFRMRYRSYIKMRGAAKRLIKKEIRRREIETYLHSLPGIVNVTFDLVPTALERVDELLGNKPEYVKYSETYNYAASAISYIPLTITI